MVKIVKLLLCLVVLAIAVQQLTLYYNLIVVGTLIKNASLANIIISAVVWPIAVVSIGGYAIFKIVKFDPKSLSDL